MDQEYEWARVREDAIERFRGELPHAQTEAEIIEVFEERPRVVLRAIEEVADSVAAGKARSGWAVLRARVHGALEPLREVTAFGNEREAAIVKAEQWIRNAGIHHDRVEEVEDELFGDRGYCRAWPNDVALKTRLLGLWSDLRPQGELVEQQAEERIRGQMEALRRAEKRLKEKHGFKGFVKPGSEQVGEDEWASA